ncbi:hypothetical protein KP509_07G058800 [Ceratopteris richardii]|uniref:Uncharacterized protein n=1 Tax=Ceratopteris richardii TaxID=49495 RepID=A0A8T2UI63_CERRI|nr:hypothetical protein KP509_07G058800 [Ceratopteris richardii]KAH7433196.1 hypothetical protein KP509_07G058800 [Ceratopteris richardii]
MREQRLFTAQAAALSPLCNAVKSALCASGHESSLHKAFHVHINEQQRSPSFLRIMYVAASQHTHYVLCKPLSLICRLLRDLFFSPSLSGVCGC